MRRTAAHGGAGPPAWQEWRRGWLLVVSALVAYGSAAVYSFSLGLFIAPLQAAFGWSRGAITGGMMISATLTAIGAPFVGRMIDVYGSRRIGIPGMVIYCLAIAMLGTTSAAIWNWWALWVLIACGSVFVKPTVWVAAVSRAFTTSRGLAIAATMTGAGIFASITPVVTTLLIDSFGWRRAYMMIGLGLAVLNLPLLLLFFGRRRGVSFQHVKAAIESAGGFAVRESMLSRRYAQLGVAALLATTAMIGVQVHFVPILNWQGLGRMQASGAAGLLGIGAVVGRIVTGFLLDRIHGPLVGIGAFAMPIIASLLLLALPPSGSGSTLMVGSAAAFIYGSALGSELDVIGYLVSRYFGTKNYGTLFGSLVALIALGAGAGPTIAGILYDHTGGYAVFLRLAIAMFAVAMLAVGTLGRYPKDFTGSAGTQASEFAIAAIAAKEGPR